jgi:RHH-type rel operon transcriptional repressor/antitoxin RelB
MGKTQINVRLSDEVSNRLDALAKRTGRTKTFYATEAIEQFLEEHEDYFLAKDALEEFRQSGDDSVGLKDIQWGTPDR